MRILHVLHHSTPYLDGYGVRSKCIVDFQRRLGLHPIVVTSAHHEMEVGRESAACPAEETFDGVTYVRTPMPAGPMASWQLKTPFLREQALMTALRGSLERTLSRHKIDIVHSHSPVLCGRPALEAARRRGIPMLYEIRAFWEDAFLLEERRFGLSSAKYRYGKSLETNLLKEVDGVVAISQHMLDDIAGRGIDGRKLNKMPNGVDLKGFAPTSRDEALASRLGLTPGRVLGFIGTFHGIEGLDCLVDAMPAIRTALPGVKLVLVGTGPEDENIRQQIARLGLGDCIIQTGRVEHQEVSRYYSVMDLLVYPRHRYRITELVTPLKPLEAMALGKAVVGSDVGGIAELLDGGRAGRLFRAGDTGHLAEVVIRLLSDDVERQQLAEQGQRYVQRERDWEALVPGYLPVYERLLSRTVKRTA